MLKLEPSPLWLPTLHSSSSPALSCHALSSTKCTRTFNFWEIFKHAFINIYGTWPQARSVVYTHTSAQCSPASVGLALARPKYTLVCMLTCAVLLKPWSVHVTILTATLMNTWVTSTTFLGCLSCISEIKECYQVGFFESPLV